LQHYEVPAPPFWQAAQNLTTHIGVGLPCLLHCAKLRAEALRGNFLLDRASTTKLTGSLRGIAFILNPTLCVVRGKPI